MRHYNCIGDLRLNMNKTEFIEWIQAHREAPQYEVYEALVSCAAMILARVEDGRAERFFEENCTD